MGVLKRVTWSDGESVVLEERQKGDWRRRHLWLPAAFWVVGLFSAEVKREWYERFATTVGSTVYMPSLVAQGRYYGLLAHEATHVAQWRKNPIRMPLFYALWPRRRALYEIEAILRGQMHVCSVGDRIPLAMHYAERLSGPWYLWAAPRNEILLTLLTADVSGGVSVQEVGVDV